MADARRWLLALGVGGLLGGCGPETVRRVPPASEPLDATSPSELDAAAASPSPSRPSAAWVGVIQANATLEVEAPRGGVIEAVHVEAGGRVEAGQVVISLRDPEAEDELAAVEAALRSDRAAVEQARVQLDAARRAATVATTLFERGAGPRADVETATLEQRRAEAELSRARAAVAQRRVRRTQLARRVNALEVRAPSSGQVAMRYREANEQVAQKAPLLRLLLSEGHQVRFAVPVGAEPITPGLRVQVMLEPDRTEIVSGTVRTVAPEVDPVSGMVIASAELETDRAVSPGRSAWVRPAKP